MVGLGGSGLLSNVVEVAAGDNHSLALKSDGTIEAFGTGGSGQLGNGASAGTQADNPNPHNLERRTPRLNRVTEMT